MNIERTLGDRYQLIECIARGGMGEVWKAHDVQLKRIVAIKLLRLDHQNFAEFIPRFEQEARLVASLSHQNIVKLHNFASVPSDGARPLFYMIMDFIQGPTLAQYIRRTSREGLYPSVADLLYIFACVARALDYAHQRGVIHRDIKPANILLNQHISSGKAPGWPVLTDFGIARRLGKAGGAGTAIGTVLGTPAYIAPEQALGRYDDPRSDVYSLGIILYEMITGRPPFLSDSPLAIIMLHVNEDPEPPEKVNAQVPSAVSQVVLKCIAKKPEERFPSAGTMVEALAEAYRMPLPFSLSRSTPLSAGELSSSGGAPSERGWHSQGYGTPAPVMPSPRVGVVTPRESISPLRQDMQQGRTAFPVSEAGIVQPSIPPVSPTPPTRKKLGRPWMILLIITLLTVVGSTVGALLWFTRPIEDPVQGRVTFIKSATEDGYTALKIDVPEIVAPPSGKAYYAWLQPVGEELFYSWKLTVNGQTIHTPVLEGPPRIDMLQPKNLFLITLERADIQPIVPDTDPSARLYYARIPANPSPVLDLHRCPVGGDAAVCA